MSKGFEFRVLIETISGSKFSYGSSSFARSGDIFTTSQSMGSVNVFNSDCSCATCVLTSSKSTLS